MYTRLSFLTSFEPSLVERTSTVDEPENLPNKDSEDLEEHEREPTCSINEARAHSVECALPASAPSAEASEVQTSAISPAENKSSQYSSKKRKVANDDRLYDAAIARLVAEPPAVQKTPVDIDELVGQTVGEKLKRLDPEMKIYCEKIIFDAIFKAECKDLTKTSHIVTPDYEF